MTTRTPYNEPPSHSVQSPSNPTPAIDLAHSVSVNTIPSLQNEFLLNEALQRGCRFEGRMSNIRRSFCLFTIFDVLFIGLMWLICIMLHGGNIWKVIDLQIKHYDIRTSLFDIFVLAICRSVLLCVFYGILHINHWIIVFITTSSTTAFCVAKVFYYNWQQTPQPVFEVLSILVSFILAWGEAWFFDFRVIPQEYYANQFISAVTDERTPLVRHYLRGLAPSRYTESVENFHSPMNSPEGSLYRFDLGNNAVLGRFPPSEMSCDEVNKYESQARNIVEESKQLLRSERWTVERNNADVIAHSMSLPNGHTIFKVTTVFNTSPRNMLNELFHEIENIPQWNPALLEAQRIQVLDDCTDIVYQLSAGGAGGLISSRDFVILRTWTQIDDSYLLATRSTEHPNVPKSSKYIRGENGVTCFLLEPGENDNQCRKQFILNVNLKGWLPQSIVNLALVDTLFDYTKCLKMHIDKKYSVVDII